MLIEDYVYDSTEELRSSRKRMSIQYRTLIFSAKLMLLRNYLFGVESETQSIISARPIDGPHDFGIPVKRVTEPKIRKGFGKVQAAAGNAVPVATQDRVRHIVAQLLKDLANWAVGRVIADGKLAWRSFE